MDLNGMQVRYHQRFFDQVGHETKCATSGNKHFFTKCHCQTYQNYEQSRQKFSTTLENKVTLFRVKMHISTKCICSFMSNWIKKSLMVSNAMQVC